MVVVVDALNTTGHNGHDLNRLTGDWLTAPAHAAAAAAASTVMIGHNGHNRNGLPATDD